MNKSFSNIIIGKSKGYINSIIEATEDEWRKQIIPKMFEGIIKSKGVIVTEIIRNVETDPDKLHAKLKSFTGHLKSEKWDEEERKLQEAYMRKFIKSNDERIILLVDTSDISKKYAEKMEYIHKVRDGSASAKEVKIANGYHTFEAYLKNGKQLAPFLNFPFSLEDKKTKSMNDAIMLGYGNIREVLGGINCLAVEDRGFDSRENYKMARENEIDLLVRMNNNRILYDESGDRLGNVEKVAEKMNYDNVTDMWVKKKKNKKPKKILVEYGYKTVYLDKSGKNSYTFMCARKGEWKIYLITNLFVKHKYECEKLIRMYGWRWKAEEAIRFMKTAINIEGIRVWYFRAIRRLIMIAFWVMGLISLLIEELSSKNLQKLFKIGKSRDNKVNFEFYKAFRGLNALLVCLFVQKGGFGGGVL